MSRTSLQVCNRLRKQTSHMPELCHRFTVSLLCILRICSWILHRILGLFYSVVPSEESYMVNYSPFVTDKIIKGIHS